MPVPHSSDFMPVVLITRDSPSHQTSNFKMLSCFSPKSYKNCILFGNYNLYILLKYYLTMCLVLAILHTRLPPSCILCCNLPAVSQTNSISGPYFLILCIFENVFLLTLNVNKLASFTFLWSPLKQIYLYLGFRDVSVNHSCSRHSLSTCCMINYSKLLCELV